MHRAELIDYLEERERRNEALFDRIDRRLGTIEDCLLMDPHPAPDVRDDEGTEVRPPSRRAGQKTDGVLRVGQVMSRPVT